MKKILFILALFCVAGTASAQFPTQDSLIKFVNKWIRNSAVDAFTNLRLNTALIGMINYADSQGIKSVSYTGSTLRVITKGKDTFDVTISGGGGGGNANSNIGSGFRLAVPNTNNIKTIFAGLNLILDSSTNTNALTFKMDTAGVASYFLRRKDSTLYTSVSRLRDTASALRSSAFSSALPRGNVFVGNNSNIAAAACNWPAPAFVDTLYSRQQFYTFDNLTSVGGITMTANGENFYTSGGNGSYNNYITIGQNESWEDYSAEIIFQLSDPGAGFGIAVGTKYQNGANTGDLLARLTTASTTGNNIYISRSIDGTNFTTGPSNITLATNDVIKLVVTYRNHIFSAQYTNLTSSQTTSAVTFTLTNAQSGIPAMGKFAIYEFSGTHQIRSIKITSLVTRNPNLALAGDSKYAGFNASTFAGRLGDILSSTYGQTAIIAGGGNKTTDLATMLQQIYLINPRQVIMDIGSNDIRAGRSVAATLATIDSIRSLIVNRGIRVYHAVIPEDSTGGGTGGGVGLTALKNAIAATYPTTYLPTVWTEMSTSNVLKASYNGGDGIHPNSAGNAAAAADIIADGLLTTCSTNLYQIGRTDNIIQRVGDSTYLSPDYRVYIDSIARKAGSSGGGGSSINVTSSTANYLPKWDGTNSLSNSQFRDDGTNTAIGTAPGTHKFQVSGGSVKIDNNLVMQGASNGIALYDRSTANAFSMYADGNNLNYIPSSLGFAGIQFDQTAKITAQGLYINGFSEFYDSLALRTRASYKTNIHSSFTRYSLIDKSYMDSVLAASGGGGSAGAEIHDSLVANSVTFDNANLGDTIMRAVSSSVVQFKGLVAGTGIQQVATDSTIRTDVTLTTNQIAVGASSLLGSSSALTYDGTTLKQENSAAVMGAVSTTALSTSSGARLFVATSSLPTANTNQLGGIDFVSRNGATDYLVGAQIAAQALGAWTATSNQPTALIFRTQNTSSLTEKMRITGSGNTGIGVSSPLAVLHLKAGTASAATAPLKFTSGTVLTTPEAGIMEYDGTNFYLSASTTRKRILLTDNTTPSNGFIPIGNGTDYTTAAITGGSTLTVTNGAGSITLAVPTTFITSGTYTPTLTNTTNITASTAYAGQYMRVGNTVTMSGEVDIDPLAGATVTVLTMTIPIASTLGASNNLSGAAANDDVIGNTARVKSNGAGAAVISFIPNLLTSGRYSYTYTYIIN